MYTKIDEPFCKNIRRLHDKGQYWCKANHDMMHCDETCPFREYNINEYNYNNTIPHNIYKA